MPYLNLDLDYFDHPKTKRLVGLLGRGSDALPIRLWCYCGKYHAENGDLTGYLARELETTIGWWGQPGRAAEALEKTGFIERTENGYKVHDWEKINGHIIALKERAQAGAAERWRRYRDAQAMLKHSSSNAGSNAPSLPSLPVKEEENGATPPAPDFRLPTRSQEAVALAAERKHSSPKPKKEFEPDSLAFTAAVFFWDYVKEWSPQALKPTDAGFQAWAKDCDLMFRLDGRTPAAFNELLDWIDKQPASKSGFSWRKNVLSPGTLRQRWKEGKFADFLPSELDREEFR